MRDLAAQIGLTEAGLYRIMKENSTKVDTLESIAKNLQVSVSVFFDDMNGVKESGKPYNEDDLITTNRNLSETVKNLSETLRHLAEK